MEGHANTTAHYRAERITRIAWFVTFVVPLILAALLLLAARSAQAAPAAALASTSGDPLAFEEELEFGEEDEEESELEEDACEVAEEEFEEGALREAEVERICREAEDDGHKKADGPGSDSVAPEECLLRSAHGHAASSAKSNRLKLTVGYTTYEPTGATVEIQGGSAHFESLHRHLGRSGVLRVSEDLGGKRAPKHVIVRFRIAGSPHYCGKFQTQKIRVG